LCLIGSEVAQRFNPFRPNGLVPPGIFTGRVEESEAMQRMLVHTRRGNPQNFLLHGERGIGKSSLLYVHQMNALGELSLWGDEKFSFITVDVTLEPADTYEAILRKLGSGLDRAVRSHHKATEVVKSAWDVIKRFEVMGVKYNFSSEKSIAGSELLDEIVQVYTATCADIQGKLDGILILLDEADKPSATANLGALLKGFTERVARSKHNAIGIGLAGVSSVLETLRQSHESALRVFTSFHLKPLSPEESVQVIRRGLNVAQGENKIKTRITPEAEALIAMYSEGYPHFLQQFSYCAFEADTDDSIDREDVLRGAWAEHGAFEQLGTKYFEGLYFEQINSNEYREVLRIMAEQLDGWVTKSQIRAALKIKESTLNNALRALTQRRIILTRPGHQGTYRLPLKSFAAWIRAYSFGPEPPLFENIGQERSQGIDPRPEGKGSNP
jgi:hypothetical protein